METVKGACEICDRDLPADRLCDGVCGPCWLEHAKDLEPEGAEWARANAARAFASTPEVR